MNTKESQRIYFEKKYKKATITKEELANELGVSISSINNYIVKGMGIPEYIKYGIGKNSKVLFPIVNVIDYLSHTIKVS